MFRNLKKQGEETPLDHIPEMDYSHNWFMEAYRTLINSSNDSGRIPLSELKIFQQEFGLIGTFKEFARIIYSISDTYAEYREKENQKEINKLG